MKTLTPGAPIVKPTAAANPRDSWPAWTDADRWVTTPGDDDHRPTAGPDFVPSAEDEAAAAELLNAGEAGPSSRPASDRRYRGGRVVKALDCVLDFYPRPSLREGGAR